MVAVQARVAQQRAPEVGLARDGARPVDDGRHTPEPVLAKLEATFQQIGRMPETVEFLKTAGGEPLEGGRAFLKTFIEGQREKWIRAIDVAKLERM